MKYDHLFVVLVKLNSKLSNLNVILNFPASSYVESGKLVSKAACFVFIQSLSICMYVSLYCQSWINLS